MKKFRYDLKHRHATWLELFFDLVFVASIGIVTHSLAHTHHGHIEIKQYLLYPIQFLAIWFIWMTHTLFANRFDSDDFSHRISSLVIMFLMITMSVFLGNDLFDNYNWFIGFYMAIRIVLASLYFQNLGALDRYRRFAKKAGMTVIFCALLAGISVFFQSPVREIILMTAILVEIIIHYFNTRKDEVHNVHREHLVERIGLMSIILLGESVISLVSSLRDIDWTAMDMMAAATGFLMVGLIWWIYYDSFYIIERLKALKHGFPLIYSHFFLAMGLVILANLIRHAILNDLAMGDFRILAISGMCFFYIGKQTVYYIFLPPFRLNLMLNTAVCVAITVASTFLPQPEYALMAITLGMAYYTFANFKWTLSKDVSDYLQ